MNFFNSIGNLLTIISSSSSENILITVLILTESFLIYFNLRVLKLMGNINDISDDVSKNYDMLKNVLQMIKILGNNQQLIFDYIQDKRLHVTTLNTTDVSLKSEDDVM